MTRFGPLVLIFSLAGCSTIPPHPPVTARVDHVIVGTSDLDTGMAAMERLTGMRPVVGGVHPGRGTRNALMSLGDGTYLEILAPDPAQSTDNDEIRELRALTRPTPIGWAVSADDEGAIRSALSGAGFPTSASQPGSRAKPDGSVLRWITFGYQEIDDLLAPFFIVWAEPALHPSRTSPSGCRLTDVRIQSPNADALARAVAPLQLQVFVSAAESERMQLSLACPKGNVSL